MFEVLLQAAKSISTFDFKVIFVGGQVASLYHTDSNSPLPRATKDVDLLVHVITRADYMKIENSMRSCGYDQRIEEPVIIRWFGHGIVIDVIPTNSSIFGFEGRWLADSFEDTIEIEIAEGMRINLLCAPNYLAAKFEAFLQRGQGDLFASHDLEDIIGVVAYRHEIVEEILCSRIELREFLRTNLAAILHSDFAFDAIEGCLSSERDPRDRVRAVIDRISAICQ